MPQRSDEELMLAAGQGDRRAFGVLVERHGATVVRFVQRFLGDIGRETAEDLAQDVFLKAWKAAAKFTPQAKVLTWLLRITTNTCLNHRRGQRLRRFVFFGNDPVPDVASRASESGDDEESRDRGRFVRTAVAALPANQRAAVVLRHYHDFSYSQIAEVLELSVPAVESLLFRARRRLEKTLRGFEAFVPGSQDPGSSVLGKGRTVSALHGPVGGTLAAQTENSPQVSVEPSAEPK
jgi:RNA polymerase sigma-70 factor (ECF subfamily)